MDATPRSDVLVFRHDGLMGTTVEVRVDAPEDAARAADDAALAEIDRLVAVFSVHDAQSELSRWRRGEPVEHSPDFCTVMGLAAAWQVRSGGRFNPAVGELAELWREAASSGVPPRPEDLRRAAAAVHEPRFGMIGGVPVATGDCSGIELNAIAKGYVVDRALDAAWTATGGAVASVGVNAGGDLAHRGTHPLRVGVENPLRPYDNEPPLAVVQISNCALATSGRARRGFRVGDRWHAHVIDPRTGATVDDVASISVIAADAATADVLATVLGVAAPAEAVAEASAMPGVACLVVDRDGRQWSDDAWRATVVPASG